ncbi:ATP-grasp domain-containing protein [Nocardia sp. NPDC050793]|uniref:ATP-grasp domain-containing protein n=1 Tax=Nocardia sp. NPDC050793 TaxID=3155159 RepID=UPI0034064F58
MSTLLPAGIGDGGHTFSFLTRDLGHYLRGKSGMHPLLGAANVLTAETNDEDTLLPYVRRLHEVLGFDGVLSSCDYYLPTVAAIAADLGLPGPGRDAVAAACQKHRTRELCRAAGVPGPAFAVVTGAEEAVEAAQGIGGYPVVVKPVDLCGGMFVTRVDDEAQLREALGRLGAFSRNARGQERSPQVLIEECLQGPEFSVETVTARGVTVVVGVTDKRLTGAPAFIEAGHMFPAALSPAERDALTGTARAAITALGLDDTVAHIEIMLTADGPRLIEVNPRPAGNRITELVRRVTGIDLAAVHAQVAAGLTPDLTVRPTGVGSAAIAFVVPREAGALTAISGAEDWPRDPRIVEHTLAEPGATVQAATNNNNYLGHVMVAVESCGTAGHLAQSLIDILSVEVAR